MEIVSRNRGKQGQSDEISGVSEEKKKKEGGGAVKSEPLVEVDSSTDDESVEVKPV